MEINREFILSPLSTMFYLLPTSPRRVVGLSRGRVQGHVHGKNKGGAEATTTDLKFVSLTVGRATKGKPLKARDARMLHLSEMSNTLGF